MTEIVLAGGKVVRADEMPQRMDVAIRDGRIVSIAAPDGSERAGASTVDVSGHLIAPGFVDLQINGGWGADFTTDPDSITDVAAHLPATGVTAFVPTIVTSAPRIRRRALERFATLDADECSSVPLGIHFEGPMISPERPGAHDPMWIGRPEDAELQTWSRDGGVVLVTLAPEVEGAPAVLRELCSRGVVVAAGHTACSAERFMTAVDAGMSMVTHLFNAMAPFAHRDPGPIGAALADDRVSASLICDGIHVDPVAVRAAWRALGPERTVLVTDAMAALGCDLATVELGGRTITVDEHGVRTTDGVLAGSDLRLDVAVRNLVAFAGCPAHEAIRTVTVNPARLLGLRDRGRIAPGARADLVVLDEALHVVRTYVGGVLAWRS